ITRRGHRPVRAAGGGRGTPAGARAGGRPDGDRRGLFLRRCVIELARSSNARDRDAGASQELAARSGEIRLAPEAASWIPAVMSYGPVPAPLVDDRWRTLRTSPSVSRYSRAFGDLLAALSLATLAGFD